MKVLYYNIPVLGDSCIDEAKRLLRKMLGSIEEVKIIQKRPEDGTILQLLRGQCRDCEVVEIDRTDPDVRGFGGLQAARKAGTLHVLVVAYMDNHFVKVEPDENIMIPLRQ